LPITVNTALRCVIFVLLMWLPGSGALNPLSILAMAAYEVAR
jgi:hypothetical protein